MAEARRESRKAFLDRVQREGRHGDAEVFYNGMIEKGVHARDARRKAVKRFQPLDGSRTVAWDTPNRWEDRPKRQDVEADPEPTIGLENEEEQRTYRGIIEWVWRHLECKNCPPTKDGRARALWKWAKANEGEFLSKHVPMLMKNEKREEEAKDEGGEAAMGVLDEWLKAYKNKPHCETCTCKLPRENW